MITFILRLTFVVLCWLVCLLHAQEEQQQPSSTSTRTPLFTPATHGPLVSKTAKLFGANSPHSLDDGNSGHTEVASESISTSRNSLLATADGGYVAFNEHGNILVATSANGTVLWRRNVGGSAPDDQQHQILGLNDLEDEHYKKPWLQNDRQTTSSHQRAPCVFGYWSDKENKDSTSSSSVRDGNRTFLTFHLCLCSNGVERWTTSGFVDNSTGTVADRDLVTEEEWYGVSTVDGHVTSGTSINEAQQVVRTVCLEMLRYYQEGSSQPGSFVQRGLQCVTLSNDLASRADHHVLVWERVCPVGWEVTAATSSTTFSAMWSTTTTTTAQHSGLVLLDCKDAMYTYAAVDGTEAWISTLDSDAFPIGISATKADRYPLQLISHVNPVEVVANSNDDSAGATPTPRTVIVLGVLFVPPLDESEQDSLAVMVFDALTGEVLSSFSEAQLATAALGSPGALQQLSAFDVFSVAQDTALLTRGAFYRSLRFLLTASSSPGFIAALNPSSTPPHLEWNEQNVNVCSQDVCSHGEGEQAATSKCGTQLVYDTASGAPLLVVNGVRSGRYLAALDAITGTIVAQMPSVDVSVHCIANLGAHSNEPGSFHVQVLPPVPLAEQQGGQRSSIPQQILNNTYLLLVHGARRTQLVHFGITYWMVTATADGGYHPQAQHYTIWTEEEHGLRYGAVSMVSTQQQKHGATLVQELLLPPSRVLQEDAGHDDGGQQYDFVQSSVAYQQGFTTVGLNLVSAHAQGPSTSPPTAALCYVDGSSNALLAENMTASFSLLESFSSILPSKDGSALLDWDDESMVFMPVAPQEAPLFIGANGGGSLSADMPQVFVPTVDSRNTPGDTFLVVMPSRTEVVIMWATSGKEVWGSFLEPKQLPPTCSDDDDTSIPVKISVLAGVGQADSPTARLLLLTGKKCAFVLDIVDEVNTENELLVAVEVLTFPESDYIIEAKFLRPQPSAKNTASSTIVLLDAAGNVAHFQDDILQGGLRFGTQASLLLGTSSSTSGTATSLLRAQPEETPNGWLFVSTPESLFGLGLVVGEQEGNQTYRQLAVVWEVPLKWTLVVNPLVVNGSLVAVDAGFVLRRFQPNNQSSDGGENGDDDDDNGPSDDLPPTFDDGTDQTGQEVCNVDLLPGEMAPSGDEVRDHDLILIKGGVQDSIVVVCNQRLNHVVAVRTWNCDVLWTRNFDGDQQGGDQFDPESLQLCNVGGASVSERNDLVLVSTTHRTFIFDIESGDVRVETATTGVFLTQQEFPFTLELLPSTTSAGAQPPKRSTLLFSTYEFTKPTLNENLHPQAAKYGPTSVVAVPNRLLEISVSLVNGQFPEASFVHVDLWAQSVTTDFNITAFSGENKAHSQHQNTNTTAMARTRTLSPTAVPEENRDDTRAPTRTATPTNIETQTSVPPTTPNPTLSDLQTTLFDDLTTMTSAAETQTQLYTTATAASDATTINPTTTHHQQTTDVPQPTTTEHQVSTTTVPPPDTTNEPVTTTQQVVSTVHHTLADITSVPTEQPSKGVSPPPPPVTTVVTPQSPTQTPEPTLTPQPTDDNSHHSQNGATGDTPRNNRTVGKGNTMTTMIILVVALVVVVAIVVIVAKKSKCFRHFLKHLKKNTKRKFTAVAREDLDDEVTDTDVDEEIKRTKKRRAAEAGLDVDDLDDFNEMHELVESTFSKPRMNVDTSFVPQLMKEDGSFKCATPTPAKNPENEEDEEEREIDLEDI